MSFSFPPRRSIFSGFDSWYKGTQRGGNKGKEETEEKPEPEGKTKTQVDLYGFEIIVTPKAQADRLKCENRSRLRAERWHKYQDKGKLPKDRRDRALKMMIRKGIPPGLRSWVWMETSGAQERMNQASEGRTYAACLKKAMEHSPFAKQIELDIPRTYPGHPWLEMQQGQQALERVLLAYAARNPRTGYCQSMNYIAAMLLLVLDKNEEKAFWMLATLIEDILYAGTYAHNLNGCHVEMRSLGELVAHKLPRLSKHLESMYCEMSVIATDWYLCLFSTSLPCETAVRVWDSLFDEGPKILFRVAVAILQLAERKLMKYDNAGELLKGVKEFARNLHNRDKLMKVAFDGIGGLPMNTIKSIRKTKQKDVDEMLRARDERLDSKSGRHKNTWSDMDQEDSDGGDSDGQSSIATAITDVADLSIS
ncbi:hypothetical protein BSKO_10153 [Bryopsis sp. KO-2023]|nr:hypothetical protein BSKO_10153 [Bryopsis sp. KO-2023]